MKLRLNACFLFLAMITASCVGNPGAASPSNTFTGTASTGASTSGNGSTVAVGSPQPTPTGTTSSDPTSTSNSDLTGSAALDSEEQAFLVLINDYRQQNGLSPLQISVTLTRSSDWMSNDMATKNYFSHTDSSGRDPFTRMADFGYPTGGYSGENIAAGNATAQDTFTQWKNSPAHNANMLGASYKAIGIARAYNSSSSYGWYWTTDFGSTVQ